MDRLGRFAATSSPATPMHRATACYRSATLTRKMRGWIRPGDTKPCAAMTCHARRVRGERGHPKKIPLKAQPRSGGPATLQLPVEGTASSTFSAYQEAFVE